MQLRLEKIVPAKRQSRFYALSICETLFGEWCLVREWGRIGAAGGQRMDQYLASEFEAKAAMNKLKSLKNNRGYATIPVQLELFETGQFCQS